MGEMGVLMPAAAHPRWQRHSLSVPSFDVVEAALAKDAAARKVIAKGTPPEVGQRVGVRLNLNIAKTQGILVHSVHKGGPGDGYRKGRGLWGGAVLGYEEYVVLDDAFFNVDQKARELIASGMESKFPMASVDGVLRGKDGDRVIDGVEVSFNPKRTHLFVDADGAAVQWASEVVIVGHRCYARGNLRMHTSKSAPAKAGNAPSSAVLTMAPSDEGWVEVERQQALFGA